MIFSPLVSNNINYAVIIFPRLKNYFYFRTTILWCIELLLSSTLRKGNRNIQVEVGWDGCDNYGVAAVPGIAAAVHTAQLNFKHGRCPTAASVATAGAVLAKLNALFRENLF